MSKRKAVFDERAGVSDWTIHDLRRTARSLMSRAGVRPDIGERVLGQAQGGVLGIYDRHEYRGAAMPCQPAQHGDRDSRPQ